MNIFRTIRDEGASTYVMSLGCWKGLISPSLKPSNKFLKSFYGHLFPPHRLITACPIELGEKIVQVDVEVVDAPIDYNLLLGCNWIHAMTAIVSSIFQVVCSPIKRISLRSIS